MQNEAILTALKELATGLSRLAYGNQKAAHAQFTKVAKIIDVALEQSSPQAGNGKAKDDDQMPF